MRGPDDISLISCDQHILNGVVNIWLHRLQMREGGFFITRWIHDLRRPPRTIPLDNAGNSDVPKSKWFNFCIFLLKNFVDRTPQTSHPVHSASTINCTVIFDGTNTLVSALPIANLIVKPQPPAGSTLPSTTCGQSPSATGFPISSRRIIHGRPASGGIVS